MLWKKKTNGVSKQWIQYERISRVLAMSAKCQKILDGVSHEWLCSKNNTCTRSTNYSILSKTWLIGKELDEVCTIRQISV